MDQPKQAEGRFTINLNYRRNKNPDAPAISGRISSPEDPSTELAFDAFEHVGEKGRYWIGTVANPSLRHALLNGKPEQGTHFVAIRENSFKVFAKDENGAPNPAYEALSDEDKAKADKQPAFWATWTRGKNDPEIRAAAWEKNGRYGPFASGTTQYPQRTKDGQEAAFSEPAVDQDGVVLDQPAPVSARAGRRARAAETEGRA